MLTQDLLRESLVVEVVLLAVVPVLGLVTPMLLVAVLTRLGVRRQSHVMLPAQEQQHL